MTTHYTTTAKALHWSIAVLILGLLGLGFYMTGLPLSPRKLQLYSWHKWAGVSVFLLAVVRLAWRATHRPPALRGDFAASRVPPYDADGSQGVVEVDFRRSLCGRAADQCHARACFPVVPGPAYLWAVAQGA